MRKQGKKRLWDCGGRGVGGTFVPSIIVVVTNCSTAPVLQEPLRDPARLQWHEVKKVEHYYLNIDAISNPMQVSEGRQPYGETPQ
jgi:hypothetical protein